MSDKVIFENEEEKRGYDYALDKLKAGKYSASDVLELSKRFNPYLHHAYFSGGLLKAIGDYEKLKNDD